jgi:hypothetical protein
MNRISVAVGIALTLAGSAEAGDSHILQGLFCNTEAQVDATFAHLGPNLTLQTAIALTNERQVVCVYADRIGYMIRDPLIIGALGSGVGAVLKYEGTLVGILVGDNPRPVEPPMKIFFVQPDMLPGAVVAGDA